MTVNGWLQLAIFVAVLTALVPFLGGYMARVYQGERILLKHPPGWLERLIYRLIGPPSRRRAGLEVLGKTTIVFSLVFFVVLYVILRTQSIHPFNPRGVQLGALGRDLQHRVLVHHEHQLAVLRRRDIE